MLRQHYYGVAYLIIENTPCPRGCTHSLFAKSAALAGPKSRGVLVLYRLTVSDNVFLNEHPGHGCTKELTFK